jgi:hypothetical protein
MNSNGLPGRVLDWRKGFLHFAKGIKGNLEEFVDLKIFEFSD